MLAVLTGIGEKVAKHSPIFVQLPESIKPETAPARLGEGSYVRGEFTCEARSNSRHGPWFYGHYSLFITQSVHVRCQRRLF